MHLFQRFVVYWLSTTLALWIVDGVFDSLTFVSWESLLLSGAVLAIANLTLKPLLVLITLPLTLLTFGLALPLINGLVLLGVARLVSGFEISGFWMGVVCALAVSLVSGLIGLATGQSAARGRIHVGRFQAGGFGERRGADSPSQAQDSRTIDGDVREKSVEKPGQNKAIDRD